MIYNHIDRKRISPKNPPYHLCARLYLSSRWIFTLSSSSSPPPSPKNWAHVFFFYFSDCLIYDPLSPTLFVFPSLSSRWPVRHKNYQQTKWKGQGQQIRKEKNFVCVCAHTLCGAVGHTKVAWRPVTGAQRKRQKFLLLLLLENVSAETLPLEGFSPRRRHGAMYANIHIHPSHPPRWCKDIDAPRTKRQSPPPNKKQGPTDGREM